MSEEIKVPLIPDCAPCIMGTMKILVPLLTKDNVKQAEYFALVYQMLSEGYSERINPAPLSVRIYRELYSRAGVEDPYREIKQVSKEAALKAFPSIQKKIDSESGYQELRACIAAALAGNVIDFSTTGHEPDLERLVEIFDEIMNKGFAVDDSKLLWKTLSSKTGRVAYLADNAGEVVFDVPLLRLFNEMNWSVTYVVKGRPMINDAVREDVIGTEIEKFAAIADTGAWALGVPAKDVSKVFLNLIEETDLVVSKGQANVETFPELQQKFGIETYYITRAKCAHISQAIGARKGDSVVLRRN